MVRSTEKRQSSSPAAMVSDVGADHEVAHATD
jgi:hypothetical protein